MISSQKIAEAERVHAFFSRLSLAYYLQNVTINCAPEPRAFGQVMEPWQRELLAPKIPMFEALAGVSTKPHVGPWSFCDILARGHDKTSLEGRLATWLLLASRRHIQGYILAEDRDQGALVLDAMDVETKLNPWVRRQLKFTRNEVRGPGGVIEVVPADAGSAYGFRGNLFIFDEWANWKKPKCRDVWRAVYSGTEKIQPRVLGVVSNAGYLGSWQHGYYQGFKKNPDFVVWDKRGQQASWMDRARVDRLKEGESQAEGRRLFDNEWIDIGEDNGYLSREDALKCVRANLKLRMIRESGVGNYVLVVDYGPRRDRTVFCIAHLNADAETVIDRMDVMVAPTSIDEVRKRLATLMRAFRPARIVIDPYQTLGLIEELREQQQPVEEVEFRAGKLNGELAVTLRTAVSHQQVLWYPKCGALGEKGEDDTETELARLVTKQKAYGYRFDHDSTNHDDRAFCLALAIHHCLQLPPRA